MYIYTFSTYIIPALTVHSFKVLQPASLIIEKRKCHISLPFFPPRL